MDLRNEWGWQMDAIGLLKSWIGALTDIGLMLLALAIVASLLVGGTLPFFGGVVGNIVSMVKDLFATYGAGQDETVFKFASDVNVDQTTEIARMEKLLTQIQLGIPISDQPVDQ